MLLPKSKLLQKTLFYFFMNPEACVYLRDLARQLEADPGNLDKLLKKLEKEGVFLSELKGKQKYYSINRHYPFYDEYESIVSKSFGLIPRLKAGLNIPGLQEAYLFGSFAQGKQDQWSDIDLLLIGNFDTLLLAKKIKKLEKELRRTINTVEMSEKEYLDRKKKKDPFLKNIKSILI